MALYAASAWAPDLRRLSDNINEWLNSGTIEIGLARQ